MALTKVVGELIESTVNGVKTFTSDIIANTLVQFNGAVSGFVKIKAPTTPTSYTLTLPPTAGTANYVLKTDGSGSTDWVAQSGGGGGANTTLSNLTSPTAINQDLILAEVSLSIPNIKTADKLVAGDSQSLNLTTGVATIPNGNSGDLQLLTGNVDGTGVAGAINISPGTNGTSGLRGNIILNANQTSLISNNLVVSSGFGIDFSATANGSGTTTSELFNDYEEGTFVPVIRGSTAAGTATYSAQRVASYTKIGRTVHFNINIEWTNLTGATGGLQVTGLPFTSNSTANLTSSVAIFNNGVALNAGSQLQGLIGPSSTIIDMSQFLAITGAVSVVAIDTTGRFCLSGSYTV